LVVFWVLACLFFFLLLSALVFAVWISSILLKNAWGVVVFVVAGCST
jgi:hypothetical protein